MIMHFHENSFEKQVRGFRSATDLNMDILSFLQKSAQLQLLITWVSK